MRLLQQDAEFAGSTPAGYIRSSVAEHRKSSREKKAADPNFCLRNVLNGTKILVIAGSSPAPRDRSPAEQNADVIKTATA